MSKHALLFNMLTFQREISVNLLCPSGLSEVGGYNALLHKYTRAVPNTTLQSNSTCGYPRPDSLSLLRDPVNSDYPWPGTLIINCAADVWFWCADQVNPGLKRDVKFTLLSLNDHIASIPRIKK